MGVEKGNQEVTGRSPLRGSGCQPSASAVPASQSGIPNADLISLRDAAAYKQARVIGMRIAQRCVKNESTKNYTWVYQAALWGAAQAFRSQDVVRLVIAARNVAFGDATPDSIKELDRASEAFALIVPWDDAPASGIEARSDATPKSGDAQ